MAVNFQRVAAILLTSETLVLTLIALVLVVLAISLLGLSVSVMIRDMGSGMLGMAGIEVLNGILLVMMIMEIVYTVTKSLESHLLVAEPFLIIGIIAGIRRIIVITAEGANIQAENPALFRTLLIELALLSGIVLAMAWAVRILRRGASDDSSE
jgi:hypothetical protein